MKLALVNLSTDTAISREVVEAIATACEHQLLYHYGPMWEATGHQVTVYESVAAVPQDGQSAPVLILDTPDVADALGYHSVSDDGRGFGRAFWGPSKENGGEILKGPDALSAIVSHEILEMAGNPYINLWADMNGGDQDAVELCDRCEAEGYEIDGVAVSNFLGPRAFRYGDGPYDYMQTCALPFEIRPGGYAIRRAKTGEIYNVWGYDMPDWKKKLKLTASRAADMIAGKGRRT